MFKKDPPLLKDVLPQLEFELQELFKDLGRNDLFDQIEKLHIICFCECNDHDCGSFYTIKPELTEVEEIEHEGFIISGGSVETYKGKIGFVEIMPSRYGNRIKTKIMNALILNGHNL